jgi:hypothetical protein
MAYILPRFHIIHGIQQKCCLNQKNFQENKLISPIRVNKCFSFALPDGCLKAFSVFRQEVKLGGRHGLPFGKGGEIPPVHAPGFKGRQAPVKAQNFLI